MWWNEFKHGAAVGMLIAAANLLAVSQAFAEPAAPTVANDVMEDAKAQLNATFKNFQFERTGSS